MEKGDKVLYHGEYNECHNHEYEIEKVYYNGFGSKYWFDLKAVKPDIFTHYEQIWSVTRYEITVFNHYKQNK